MSYHFAPVRPTPTKTRIYNELKSIPLARAFLNWAQYLQISSKDLGVVQFNPNMWFDSQWLFIEPIFLHPEIHFFVYLKGRQEGITTVGLSFDLFYHFKIDNLLGALVSADYKISDQMRVNLRDMYSHLPRQARQTKKQDNALFYSFRNGSTLKYLFLTGRQGKKGNMGRSGAHNYAHFTEVASFPNLEDYNAFTATLSHEFPQRLYVYEYTANGYNIGHEIWETAKKSDTQIATFLAWWTKETYRLEDPGKYGYNPVGWEKENIDLVKKLYGHEIDIHQLAWWRKHKEEEVSDLGMMPKEDVMLQEYPFTEFDAFRLSGKSFFQPRMLQEQEENPIPPIKCLQPIIRPSKPEETRFEETPAGSIKIWEDFESEAQYILGADPSYGANPDSDNAVIEIYKAHKDRLIQVLEYCDNIVDTFHFSWIYLSLAGMWSAPQILEVNGPGRAVLQHLDLYKRWIREHDKDIDRKMTIFDYAKKLKAEYLWRRPDSLGTGYSRQWLTSPTTREYLLYQFQSAYHNHEIVVRSGQLVKEMEYFTKVGAKLEAEPGKNDDRVLASAMVCEFWSKYFRARLETFDEYEAKKKRTQEEKKIYDTPEAAFMQNFVRDIISGSIARR